MTDPPADCPAPCCDRGSASDTREEDTGRADLFGIVCSVGCAIHCAAMPLLIAAAPAVGGSWLGGEAAHVVLLPLCAAAALWSVRSGVRRHGRRGVPVLAAAGVSLLGAAIVAPHLLEERSVGEEAVACTAACCAAGLEPSPGDAPAAAALRRAVPLLTPLGGGLLVLAHLVNLFARPRTVPPAAGGAAVLPAL